MNESSMKISLSISDEVKEFLSFPVSKHVQEQLASGRDRTVISEASLTNLAPRKPDWDLKRAVEPRLRKLEKRTRRAITELIREWPPRALKKLPALNSCLFAITGERLQEGEEDLAASVTSGTLVR